MLDRESGKQNTSMRSKSRAEQRVSWEVTVTVEKMTWHNIHFLELFLEFHLQFIEDLEKTITNYLV